MKRCSKCKKNKQLSEFHKNQKHKDSLRYCCKICCSKYQKSHLQTERGKANNRAKQERFKIRHPNYIKAKHAVNNAVQAGKTARPDTLQCHYCPKQAQQYHHWHGYEPEHWLDIIPVCTKCHQKCHRKIA